MVCVLGEANVQQEMKQNLEGMIEKLTAHCNDLKQQMQMQEKHRNDLVKERDFLERKVEQLEDDVRRANERIDDADGIRSSLTGMLTLLFPMYFWVRYSNNQFSHVFIALKKC